MPGINLPAYRKICFFRDLSGMSILYPGRERLKYRRSSVIWLKTSQTCFSYNLKGSFGWIWESFFRNADYGNRGCRVLKNCQKLGIILVIKWFKKWYYQKISMTKYVLLSWYLVCFNSYKKLFTILYPPLKTRQPALP